MLLNIAPYFVKRMRSDALDMVFGVSLIYHTWWFLTQSTNRGYPARRVLSACVSMAGRVLLAGYPRNVIFQYSCWQVIIVTSHEQHGVSIYLDIHYGHLCSTYIYPSRDRSNIYFRTTLIARFMGPTWGPAEADMTQVGPMLAPWTLLSG